MSVRRACRVKKNLKRKHLTLTDNMSCLGAFEKGRSASYGLNNLCRRLCAYKVAGQIQVRGRYIETDRNVADAGSRLKDEGKIGGNLIGNSGLVMEPA
eukprot:9803536-Heterocapsa_arctica.AAC.1